MRDGRHADDLRRPVHPLLTFPDLHHRLARLRVRPLRPQSPRSAVMSGIIGTRRTVQFLVPVSASHRTRMNVLFESCRWIVDCVAHGHLAARRGLGGLGPLALLLVEARQAELCDGKHVRLEALSDELARDMQAAIEGKTGEANAEI